jgi:hypothetical protein
MGEVRGRNRVGGLAATALAGVLLAGAAVAQPNPGAPLPTSVVPTTKVLAIGRVTPLGAGAGRRAVMPSEVRETVKLYLAGKIDQWYVLQDGGGVAFILNTGSVDEARAELEALPLGQAKMMTFELIPLGPLNPLRLLLAPPDAPAKP